MLTAFAACVSTPIHTDNAIPPPRVRTSHAAGALPAPEFLSLERERRRRQDEEAAAAPPAAGGDAAPAADAGGGGGGDSGLNFVMPGAAREYLYSRASGTTTCISPHRHYHPAAPARTPLMTTDPSHVRVP